MIARRIVDEGELAKAFEFIAHNPMMKRWVQAMGFRLSLDEFLAQKEKFYLVTFDPTDEPTPPPLKADLKWVWLVIALVGALVGRLCSAGMTAW